MFYAVKRGKNPGIYTSWNECREQINKFPNADFKKFSEYKVARAYFDNESIHKVNKINKYFKVTSQNNKIKIKSKVTNIDNDKRTHTINEYFKINSFEKCSQKIFNIASDDSMTKTITINTDTTNTDTKTITINTDTKNKSLECVNVYTDGSCINNGKKNARGGVGVWFGENDFRNISIKLDSKKPTNQLAELTAILMSLDILIDNLNNIKLYIYTDSDYSIKCITRYCKYWEKNDWKKKDGKEVKNLDSIKKIYKYYTNYSNITFIHIKAHTNNNDIHSYGNSMADKLAVAGAKY